MCSAAAFQREWRAADIRKVHAVAVQSCIEHQLRRFPSHNCIQRHDANAVRHLPTFNSTKLKHAAISGLCASLPTLQIFALAKFNVNG